MTNNDTYEIPKEYRRKFPNVIFKNILKMDPKDVPPGLIGFYYWGLSEKIGILWGEKQEFDDNLIFYMGKEDLGTIELNQEDYKVLAPRDGLEPPTQWLTATCSTD